MTKETVELLVNILTQINVPMAEVEKFIVARDELKEELKKFG